MKEEMTKEERKNEGNVKWSSGTRELNFKHVAKCHWE